MTAHRLSAVVVSWPGCLDILEASRSFSRVKPRGAPDCRTVRSRELYDQSQTVSYVDSFVKLRGVDMYNG
jgi:hypothetical protein